MASLFKRDDSPYLWMRFKRADGKWCSKSTGKRHNVGEEVRSAELLCRKLTLKEITTAPVRHGSEWENWVPEWIETQWGYMTNTTPDIYRRAYRKLTRYFADIDKKTPASLTRELVMNYIPWRKEHKGARNIAIADLKFLAQILDEAIVRGYATTNVARMRFKKTAPAEKSVWSDDEIATVERALESTDKYGWMHVTILMGLHQAVRIRQSQVPLGAIDFNRKIIDYPGSIVKGGKGYSQPINPEFLPTLKKIVAHRKSLGEPRLCEVPELAGLENRQFLDGLGFRHLVHHGLRVTWITRAALAGVPETLAKRFANHLSSEVHRIYQKITAHDLLPMLDQMRLTRIAKARSQAQIDRPSADPLEIEAIVSNVPQ